MRVKVVGAAGDSNPLPRRLTKPCRRRATSGRSRRHRRRLRGRPRPHQALSAEATAPRRAVADGGDPFGDAGIPATAVNRMSGSGLPHPLSPCRPPTWEDLWRPRPELVKGMEQAAHTRTRRAGPAGASKHRRLRGAISPASRGGFSLTWQRGSAAMQVAACRRAHSRPFEKAFLRRIGRYHVGEGEWRRPPRIARNAAHGTTNAIIGHCARAMA